MNPYHENGPDGSCIKCGKTIGILESTASPHKALCPGDRTKSVSVSDKPLFSDVRKDIARVKGNFNTVILDVPRAEELLAALDLAVEALKDISAYDCGDCNCFSDKALAAIRAISEGEK